MVAFWKGALGYEQQGPRDEGWTLLRDPQRSGPNLAFRREPEAPGPYWWFHLDLYSSDPVGEVARLVGLGATVREPAQDDHDFVTLADPDGNLFDLVATRGYSFGQRTDG